MWKKVHNPSNQELWVHEMLFMCLFKSSFLTKTRPQSMQPLTSLTRWFRSSCHFSCCRLENPFSQILHLWGLRFWWTARSCLFNEPISLNPRPHSLHTWSFTWLWTRFSCALKLDLLLKPFPLWLQFLSLIVSCANLLLFSSVILEEVPKILHTLSVSSDHLQL